MRKLKKALCLLLAMCMISMQVVTVAWAEAIPAETTEKIEEVVEQQEETKVGTEASAEIVLTAELDNVIVTLKADKDAFENEGELSLVIKPVEIEDTEEEAALNALEKENVAKRVTYDITVLDDGDNIEPVKEVKVSFELKDAPSGADGVNIYHHDEEEGIEKIATQVLKDDAKAETAKVGEAKTEMDIEAKEVSEEELANTDDVAIIDDVTVDGFSLYTVDFTYKDKTISIAGDSTGNKLDDIVSRLGIEEKVEGAHAYEKLEEPEEIVEGETSSEVQNTDGDTLFSVYEDGETWYVDAVNAFQTEHGLVIKTADGSEYRIKVTDDAITEPPINCLTFKAVGGTTDICLKKGNGNPDAITLFYQKNSESASAYPIGNSITLSSGDTVKLWGSSTSLSKDKNNYYKFSMSGTGTIEASGAVNSLINNADLSYYCFYKLFLGCECLTTAPALPATTLKEGCYCQMFDGCISLTETMPLEATVLARDCYMGMFWTCTGLIKVPNLPATTLAPYCYQDMFSECNSLTTVPDLPDAALAEGCYQEMYKDCKSLTTVPRIKAQALADKCFRRMFEGCDELVLKATSSEAAQKEWVIAATGDPEKWNLDMFNDCPNVDLGGANPKVPNTYVTYFTLNDPEPTPPEKPASKDNSGEWTSKPTSKGSATAPISNGSWVNTNGTFTYLINGEPARNAMAWIIYTAADGKQYTGCFYFDKTGKMATGWQQIDNVWYYFEPAAGPTQGMMKVTGWVETNGKLYYLGADGKMLVNTTTPDGRKVGADGAMIQ